MKRIIFTGLILLFLIAIQGYSQDFDVAENEITSGVPEVEFNNFTGSWEKREDVADVRGIGESLSKAMIEDNQWSRYYLKYSVIHAVSDEETDKLGADIFSVDKNAKVNHIYSVRLIIAGFLAEEYGYSDDDAFLLAKFITYYNAYYRGDTNYFSTKYKTVVTDHLTAENAGISINYYDWPGKTRIVIPLTRFAGGGNISSIDTDIVSDDDMTNEKTIEERDKLIQLKEDQLDEMEDINKKKQEELDEKIDEKDKLDEEIEEKKKELEETDDEDEKKKLEEELEEKEKEKEELEEDIDKLEEDIDENEEDIEKKKETVEKDKEKLEEDKNTEKIKSDPDKAVDEVNEREKELDEREEKITEKEDELDEREDKLRDELLDDNVYNDKLYYLQINNYFEGGYYNNKMYIIDPDTMDIEVTSSYKTISGDDFDVYSGGVVVIGYQGDSYLNHQLILLDLDTLSPKYDSSDFVFHRSFVEIYDDYIYVIIMVSDKYYLAKYDTKLDRVARSSEAVAKDTFISFYGNKIYVNNALKNIMVLNMDDLSLVDTIKP